MKINTFKGRDFGTKRIGNPSLYRLADNNILILYRTFINNTRPYVTMLNKEACRYCVLNNDLEIISDQQPLISNLYYPYETLSDTRLFEYNNNLYCSSNIVYPRNMGYSSSMGLIHFTTQHLLRLTKYKQLAQEKNWVFFEYNTRLFCTYSLWNNKHSVYEVDMNTGQLYLTHLTKYDNGGWCKKYGQIRPTSNMVEHNGLLWGMLHSKIASTKNLPGYKYFSTFYNINPEPPFNVINIGVAPIISDKYKWCIFPNGLIRHNNGWLIGAGIDNPHKIYLIEIPDEEVSTYIKEAK